MPNKLVGVLMSERGVLRAGQGVYREGSENPDAQTNTEIGIVTSGSFSPTLGYSVGLARIAASAGDKAEIHIRGKRKTVRFVTPGFVRNGKISINQGDKKSTEIKDGRNPH